MAGIPVLSALSGALKRRRNVFIALLSAAVVAATLTTSGAAGAAGTRAASATGVANPAEPNPDGAVCPEASAPPADETPSPDDACVLLSINLGASPNPPGRWDIVTFSYTVYPATDCWDSFGNSFPWGTGFTFQRGISDQSDPFTWTVYCMGFGVESASLVIDIQDESPPPPPPPPPPAPQCSNGVDDDGDGLVDYPADPGCTGTGDDTEAPNPEPPPPPPPPEYPLEAAETTELESQEGIYLGGVRCVRKRLEQAFRGISFRVVLRYEMDFRVCYRRGHGITQVTHNRGDATYSEYPYYWRGNDSGYPSHLRFFRRVEFRYRGTVEVCPLPPACGLPKHPWVTVVFNDQGQIERWDRGVA